ncbi:hypothetical protein [Lewinella sp. IMCC34183]|uniref:hypothetical protein n=1 Tax=Lewinella sp. IMCC34183 TaxID=2248762 RepID=UPI000E22E910|nr:hypothetical protein [Lewinella sp. IMCC34183]
MRFKSLSTALRRTGAAVLCSSLLSCLLASCEPAEKVRLENAGADEVIFPVTDAACTEWFAYVNVPDTMLLAKDTDTSIYYGIGTWDASDRERMEACLLAAKPYLTVDSSRRPAAYTLTLDGYLDSRLTVRFQ